MRKTHAEEHPRRASGRIHFFVRRAAAVATAIYLGFYVSGLVVDGRRMPLGDLGRAHPALRYLEIAMIGLVAFHATSSLSLWLIETTSATRRHRTFFAISIAVAVLVALTHVPILIGGP